MRRSHARRSIVPTYQLPPRVRSGFSSRGAFSVAFRSCPWLHSATSALKKWPNHCSVVLLTIIVSCGEFLCVQKCEKMREIWQQRSGNARKISVNFKKILAFVVFLLLIHQGHSQSKFFLKKLTPNLFKKNCLVPDLQTF